MIWLFIGLSFVGVVICLREIERLSDRVANLERRMEEVAPWVAP